MTPVRNNLVTLGTTAVIAVYAAGFARTKSAAYRFAEADAARPGAPAMQHAPESTRVAPHDSSSTDKPLIADNHPLIPGAPEPAPRKGPKRRPTADSTTIVTSRRVETMAGRDSSTINPARAVAQAIAKIADSSSAPGVVAVPPTTSPPSQSAASATQAVDPSAPNRGPYKDGQYSGWGTSRHGDIQATVEIRDGHIVSANISQCRTRYSCSWIAHLPSQVVSRQSANVDYVSGATQSTSAYYYAIVEALSQAQ